ncbi:beta-mannosidase precursor [Pelomyxa schiedti]|nr:beta-mannosidase precursor [Pelomyxa schiedti]
MVVRTAVVVLLAACIVLCAPPYEMDLGGSSWTVKNSTSPSYQATVPGVVHTDLINAGVIEDPYYRYGDVDYRWVGLSEWTYSRTFTATTTLLSYKKVLLVCDGLDTAASVILNGVTLGTANNMFRRYTFDITSVVKSGTNSLQLAFQSAATYADEQAAAYPYTVPSSDDPCQNGEDHRNFIRKEQCSFSWDWGPCFIPEGIWQSIRIVAYSEAMVSEFSVGVTPKSGLSTWTVTGRVFIISSGSVTGTVTVAIDSLKLTSSKSVTLTAGENLVSIELTATNPSLWWPNGVSPNTRELYSVKATFTSTKGETSSLQRNIGFRKLELIQEEITGEEGLSFYIKVNNVPVFSKGSNWIPADSFENRATEDVLEDLLSGAVEANMNMLRNWGGGVYQSDLFYDLADEYGLMIWEDIMFACAMYPRDITFLENVVAEVKYQVRRTMSHPSIIIWSANNENEGALNWYSETVENPQLYTVDYSELYLNTIQPLLSSEDAWRPFVPSSPSNGALVDTSELYVGRWGNVQSEIYGDVHFYDYTSDCWDINIFPKPRFASEYGYQSYPSINTWLPVTETSDLNLYSDLMNHRQHHAGGNDQIRALMELHFKYPENSDSVTQFADFCYVSQVVQAVCIKSETETYRRYQSVSPAHTMGALYWQLNDIWQGPTWSSIEYGGRWKLLHNYAKDFFAPLLVSPYEDPDDQLNIFIVNDNQYTVSGTVTVSFLSWSDGSLKFSYTSSVVAVDGISSILALKLVISEITANRNDGVFLMTLNDAYNATNVLSSNIFYPSSLSAVTLPKATITLTDPVVLPSGTDALITLESDAMAPFVFMQSTLSGHWLSNGFLLQPFTPLTLQFHSKEAMSDANSFYSSLSVRSLRDTYA